MSPPMEPIEIESRSSQLRVERPTTRAKRIFCACIALLAAVAGAALCAGRLSRYGTAFAVRVPQLRPAPRQVNTQLESPDFQWLKPLLEPDMRPLEPEEGRPEGPSQAADETTAGARHAPAGAGGAPALGTLVWQRRAPVAASGADGPLVWVHRILEDKIPGIEHLEVLDVSDGHTASGFVDGSNRSQNPAGLELRVTIVSGDFEGMRLLQRQRMVNEALSAELASGIIHSLPSLRTLTPEQWQAGETPALELKF